MISSANAGKLGSLMRLAWLATVTIVIASTASAQDVRPFTRGTWDHIRAAHAGSPFVIHFWGVACAPCRVEMPVWGQLLKERADLKLVTVHADRMPPDERLLPQMLSDAGLSAAEGWRFAERFMEPLRYEVDPEWQGEIPMTLLIARDGKSTSIVGSIEPGQIRDWLDEQKRTAP